MPAEGSGRGSSGAAQGWTTLADLQALSLKAWNSGALLRELVEPAGLYPRRRPLKRPTAATLRSDYAAARAWAAELAAAAGRFSLETAEVGRTTIGANQLPAAAVYEAAEDEIAFVGRTKEAARFVELAAGLAALDPAFRRWALRRPLKLLELGADALTAARVALWLRDNPGPGIYVRQLSLAGVHTKFVETHRAVIGELAGVLLATADALDPAMDPAEDAVLTESPAEPGSLLGLAPARTPAARFAAGHGFLHPPELVRFRLLDPDMQLLGQARDLAVTAEAFSTLDLPVQKVLITENLVNFLALPARPDTLAIYGGGYGFSSLRDAEWLRNCEVLYWGDLDTHGFRILDQLRAVHPHVASVLMDQATLLAHRDVWGTEPAPSRAALTRLTAGESALYDALRGDTFGTAVRLEQELIRWDWALARTGG
ncbi:Wadjet anti-phage system protein JetD domain-containing protein [Pseudarthrobacter sp. DSP2-3-2b1]|uniref:Wadjet anti-phage system protein JetD domain-containing protein n=1 Tax=Pseudarthrobacter sp. DSP2-3-2b1 TaxID=2804661 RepID=UPI003CED4AD5